MDKCLFCIKYYGCKLDRKHKKKDVCPIFSPDMINIKKGKKYVKKRINDIFDDVMCDPLEESLFDFF